MAIKLFYAILRRDSKMSYPLNQYQRRVAKRHRKEISSYCFLTTVVLFFIGYLLIRTPLMNSMYEEVFASGNRTLEQVQAARFNAYALPLVIAFVITWSTLTTLAILLERKRHNNFDFGNSDTALISEIEAGHTSNLYRTTPGGFEQRVAWLITQQTGYRTQVTGRSGDKGADIKVFDSHRHLVGVVQCKRYRPNKALPPAYVQQMVGIRQTFNVNIVYLATTAYFTEDTKRLAKQLDIRLIDGYDLRHISRKVALPMQRTPSSKYAFDPDPHARFRPSQQSVKPDDNRSLNGMWDE